MWLSCINAWLLDNTFSTKRINAYDKNAKKYANGIPSNFSSSSNFSDASGRMWNKPIPKNNPPENAFDNPRNVELVLQEFIQFGIIPKPNPIANIPIIEHIFNIIIVESVSDNFDDNIFFLI